MNTFHEIVSQLEMRILCHHAASDTILNHFGKTSLPLQSNSQTDPWPERSIEIQ